MYLSVATLIVPGMVAIILDVLRAEMGTRGAKQFHIGFDGKTWIVLRAAYLPLFPFCRPVLVGHVPKVVSNPTLTFRQSS